MTEHKEGEAYGWTGGECPVHPRTKVQLLFRSAEKYGPCEWACEYPWDHVGKSDDIIAFRIVKLHREPMRVTE